MKNEDAACFNVVKNQKSGKNYLKLSKNMIFIKTAQNVCKRKQN